MALSILVPAGGLFYLSDQLISAELEADLLHQDSSQLSSELEKNRTDLDADSQKAKQLEIDTAKLQTMEKGSAAFNSAQEVLNKGYEMLRQGDARMQRLLQMKSTGHQLGLRRVQLQASAKRLRLLFSAITFVTLAALAGIYAAYRMMVSGFREWHSTQIVADELLRAQLKSKNPVERLRLE